MVTILRRTTGLSRLAWALQTTRQLLATKVPIKTHPTLQTHMEYRIRIEFFKLAISKQRQSRLREVISSFG